MNNSKVVLFTRLSVVFIILTIVLIIIFHTTNKSSVSISTVEGAKIFVSESLQEEPKLIGSTDAKYSTRKSGTLYVLVSKDKSITQTSTEMKLRQNTQLSVELRDVTERQKLADGALAFLYFDKDFAYGVNPDSKSISFVPLGNKQIPDANFSTLPYASKLTWKDTRNFTFNTYGEDVHNVINGQKFVDIDLGEGQGVVAYFDHSQYAGKPLVLLNKEGIYSVSDFRGEGYKKLVNLYSLSGNVKLFSDQKYIYLANQQFAESRSEGANPTATKTVITSYDYDGNKVEDIELPNPQEVSRVFLVGNSSYVILGENELYFADVESGNIVVAPYYFSGSKDVIYINDRLLVLNKKGLWEFNTKTKAYHLLSEFAEGEEYVANSLIQIKDKVYFSSKSSRDSLLNNSGNKSYVYSISP